MLVDMYGSDSSGDESTPPQLNKSTSLSLPSSHASGSGSSSLTLPAPKVKKAPKKIAIDLPALPKDGSANHESDEAPPAKKPRTETRGTGSSALFSRLPAPKLAAPVKVKATPERVLGSGNGPGLVFNNPPPQRVQNTFGTPSNVDAQSGLDGTEEEQSVSLSFMPVSVMKGKANVSLEESFSERKASAPDPSPPAAVDLFSLSTSYYLLFNFSAKHVYPDSTKSSSASVTNSKGIAGSLSISSAPKIDEYVPPEPTPDDPYPGYYQLPSGNWASYDPTYYQQFYNKWKADYDREVRALETKAKGFEKADADDTQEINALHEMEKAKKEIQDREEKKALTQGAGGEPEAPRMNVKVRSPRWSLSMLCMLNGTQGSKISKGARKRGQLASLLVEAYQNREALEEKIAEGRRNRKEAGNKYGAVHIFRSACSITHLRKGF
jgi:proline-rich protein PRCC